MKIYLAGNTAVEERERCLVKFFKARLLSYYYMLPGSGSGCQDKISMDWLKGDYDNMVGGSARGTRKNCHIS